MIFEWDPEKEKSNIRKHGISFPEAATVFGDPVSSTFDDPDHSVDEQRFIIIGYSNKGRLLFVSHTVFVSHTDDEITVRIISVREVTANERKYHEQKRQR